jgi:hypothetical protein
VPIPPTREEQDVDHPNAELLRAHLDALAGGDIATAMSLYADDVVFHYPGSNPLAGTYRGKQEVLRLMGTVMELTKGTFRPEVHDVVASDEHVAALVTVRAERDGAPVEWRSVDVFHVRDGKLSEHWVNEVDQETVDRFWSGSSGS